MVSVLAPLSHLSRVFTEPIWVLSSLHFYSGGGPGFLGIKGDFKILE